MSVCQPTFKTKNLPIYVLFIKTTINYKVKEIISVRRVSEIVFRAPASPTLLIKRGAKQYRIELTEKQQRKKFKKQIKN